MERETRTLEKRYKSRFPFVREVRYKVLDNDTVVDCGASETINIGSGGVLFGTRQQLKRGCFIELSISWPVLLMDNCAMRLVVYGRVLRSDSNSAACSVDKYEFRTQARHIPINRMERTDPTFQRWVDGLRKETVKARAYYVPA